MKLTETPVIVIAVLLVAFCLGVLVGWMWPRVGRYDYIIAKHNVVVSFDTATGDLKLVVKEKKEE